MVVDDDHDLVDSLCEWVGLNSDWSVVPAYGCAQALAQARGAAPDVILLGMEMPGGNGFETAERLRRLSGDEPPVILALTSRPQSHAAARSDPRFAASLLKPADPGQLLVLLSRAVPDH
jgi:CheY-like chemotaxis protein